MLDKVLSDILHKYNHFGVTLLLIPPSLLFNPEYIIIPVAFMSNYFGWVKGARYFLCIMLAFSVS